MNNKLNNMMNQFFENTDAKNDEELNQKLQEFLQKYNNGEIEYQNTPLDDAYELLNQAERAKSKRQAIKLAQEALTVCPDCFDANLFLIGLEDNALKREKQLNEGLAKEKDRLTKEGYFDKENIGSFYGIFETRPYIRGLYIKAHDLALEGKQTQAKKICEEILRLNHNDNTGARYLLMAIDATLEEKKDMLKLYKKYPEEHLEMLFPFFALYYKLGNDEKAKEYLERITKANPNFVKFFKGTMKEDENTPPGYYSKGGSSEIMMYFMNYIFLISTMKSLPDYVLENSKKKKR